uniref:NADH dehydrogenase subunit 6 n=1 Tax=Acrobeloides nanus TaxID=290746 RepID=A0A914DMJ0_9BILA
MGVKQLKAIFFVLVILATILTMLSLFTPGWKHFEYGRKQKVDNSTKSTLANTQYDECVVAFLILALIFETIILVVSTLHAKKFVSSTATFYFEAVFAFLIVIFLLAAIVKYSVDFRDKNDPLLYYEDDLSLSDFILNNTSISNFNFTGKSGYDYGYWIAVLALIVMIFAAMIGIFITVLI